MKHNKAGHKGAPPVLGRSLRSRPCQRRYMKNKNRGLIYMSDITREYKLYGLFILLLSTLVSTNTYGYDFKYKDSLICGPKKLNEFEGYKSLGSNRWEYYFFNFSEDGDFVILNDDIQYPSFTEVRLYNLYHQNGGVFTATHTKNSGVDVYKLINKVAEPVWVKTIMVDMQSMTYVARVSKGGKTYKPFMGVCYQ